MCIRDRSTLLPPATSVSGLQPAFHIRHLFEIQEALEMMKQTEKVQCEKCTKISQTATNSCRDCIYLQQVSPEQCYAIGNGVEIAKLGERAAAVLHLVNIKRKVCTTPVATPTCELVSTITHLLIWRPAGLWRRQRPASMKSATSPPVERGTSCTSKWRVSTSKEVHLLSGTPIKTISRVNEPWGVAVNQRDDIIVAESDRHRVSIFSPAGEKVQLTRFKICSLILLTVWQWIVRTTYWWLMATIIAFKSSLQCGICDWRLQRPCFSIHMWGQVSIIIWLNGKWTRTV